MPLLTRRLVEEKKYDEAVPYLEQILTITPNDFYAHYQLGNIARTKEQCDKSRQHFSIALANAQAAEDQKTIREAINRLDLQCK